MRRVDLHSIRWRLPLTYAAIAFLAALSLGAVLLVVLHDFYKSQERDYLQENAYAVSTIISETLQRGKTISAVSESGLRNLAFFADIRIQLQDGDGYVVVDSGTPSRAFITMPTEVAVWASDGEASQTNWWTGGSFTVVYPEHGGGNRQLAGSVQTSEVDQTSPFNGVSVEVGGEGIRDRFIEVFSLEAIRNSARPASISRPLLPIARAPYGFYLTARPDQLVLDRRSDQAVTVNIQDVEGISLGFVRVFEGPAYGSDILDSVARSWLFASGVAIFLAAMVGWIMSREVTAPLLSLTETTARMADGDLSARSHLVRDDEFGKLSVAFNNMAHRVESTVLALRRFVADAAHELHTPLTALRTNIELSAEIQITPTLSQAMHQVQRLEVLADSLLDLSRIETMMDQRIHDPADFTQVVQGCAEMLASRAEQKGIRFTQEIPDSSFMALGNAYQLERMVNNLMDNALKFTPNGGTIAISLSDRHQQIKFTIQDSGIGIPPDDIPYLFERFRRGSNTANYPGSGLGLAIVKAIVDIHHGDVQVMSQDGLTNVTVRLPLYLID